MQSLTDRVDALFAEWDRPDSPGCALAVVWDGAIVYARGYGMADLEHDVPLASNSVFDIASTSKQFVAMCVLLLSDQGKLSLDDDIRRHIPEMPAYPWPITVRHLIHHTSGIRDYLELMTLAGLRFENDYYEEEIIALLARQKELNYRPGDEHLYSNSGYFLLGEIVRRTSGQSLGDFAREHIFQPLGMNSTRFYDDFTAIVPHRAIGYAPREGGGYGIETYKFDLVGDGGVLTTVGDLFLWDQNFYANRLGGGGPGLVERMLTPGMLSSGEPLDYAFGLGIGQYRGLPTVSHGGSWAGYRSEMIRFPAQRFSVICLANLAGFDPTGLCKRVADLYLADAFAQAPDPAAGGAEPAPLSAADLEGKTGAFRNPESHVVLRLSAQEGRLMVDHPSGLVFQLAPTGPGQFRAHGPHLDPELTFAFEEATADRPARWHVTTGSGPATLEAVELPPPDSIALDEYAGEYESDELEALYRLRVEDERLVLRLRYSPDRLLLRPTVRDEFNGQDRMFRFTRDDAGRVSGCEVYAGRVRNIRFQRR